MALLIDGYNLLNVTDIFGEAGPGTELHRTRLAFLNFLASSITSASAGKPRSCSTRPGAARLAANDYARRHDGPFRAATFRRRRNDRGAAGTTGRAPRSLVVVSSDHRVQRAARQRGASFIDSEQWYADIRDRPPQTRQSKRTTLRQSRSASTIARTNSPTGSENSAIRQARLRDSESPFPPGYGDDDLRKKIGVSYCRSTA